ncbi:MAG: arginase family protein [Bacteroidales bacterium]|nr:arginase family protein [Bacteroidales bacterium]
MDELKTKISHYLSEPYLLKENFSDFEERMASVPFFYENINVELNNFDIAILGIDNKNADNIRKHLFRLYKPQNIKIIDLGNLIADDNPEINFLKISEIFKLLDSNDVKLVLLSDNEQNNIGLYQFFQKEQVKFDALNIDSYVDFQSNENITSTSYLNYFQKNENLFSNFTILGYQKYIVNSKVLKTVEEMDIKAFRLSQVISEISEFEPIFRNSHLVSVDISAVKASDAPANEKNSPNGFDANQICLLSYFAGLSDNIKSFALHEISQKFDVNDITAKLGAQILWHFIDAFSTKIDVDKQSNKNYRVYFIMFSENDSDFELKFSHCLNTNRWWVEVINLENNKLWPCTNMDYEQAKIKKLSPRLRSYLSNK